MSVVSNVILAFPAGEDEAGRIAEVNAYFVERGRFGFKVTPEGAEYPFGGDKNLDRATFVAAFNKLDDDAFLKHIAERVTWQDPDLVQVFICGEDDDGYRLRHGRQGRDLREDAPTPDPRHWYMHECDADEPRVTIYDGADVAVLTVASREADEDFVGMTEIKARALALFILAAVGATKPIEGWAESET